MSARIKSIARGSSPDATVNGILEFSQNSLGDAEMFGLLARRPELLKRVASMIGYFLGGQGGLLEPALLELVRLRGANLNACTYCATVRLQPVAAEVKPKEAGLGLRDISGLSKAQAIAAARNTLQTGAFTPREAAALKLVDRIAADPHSVDDALFAELRKYFSDEEIIDLACAISLFGMTAAVNTVIHVGTSADSIYGEHGAYAAAS